ncbi:MAG TPA: ribonuclease III [Lacipirellulaceae bacterium]|jgi:ribonuclease-3|nr:ribonuclease III [Lacipirellulaceae bacterium]
MSQSPRPGAEPNDDTRIERCQQRLGYQFRDTQLLESALTHASGADHRLSSNERLEFLGDAILGLVVCEQLFQQFPEQLEGDLTKLKSIVVSRQTCAKISQALGLREFLVLGKGMTTNPAVPPSVLSDVLESLIAGIYLDGGMPPAKDFILAYFGPEIEAAAAGDTGGNYKSLLQQFAQREHGVTPTYHLLDEKGPDHSKCFKISAQIGRDRYAPAWGRSKKESEQRAAHNAICELRGDPVPYAGEESANTPPNSCP